MGCTAAGVLVDRREVHHMLGLPGEGIAGSLEALRQSDAQFVEGDHEEAAVFMACAFIKIIRKVRACLANSDPETIHLGDAPYGGWHDGASVLAITGQTYRDIDGTFSRSRSIG